MASPDSNTPPTDGWQILNSRYVINTEHLRLRADTVRLPSGLVVDDYFVRESRGYSITIALTPEQQVLLVRQYKHGIGGEVLELPAGAIDGNDETAAECAIRELAEETGYVGDAPEHIASFITDPTGSTSRFHVYLIRNAVCRGEQQLDSTEYITVELASLLDVHAMVRDGRIDVAPHVTAVLTLLDRVSAGLIQL
jgi:ADP-ribose pyrophosphatase